MKISIEFKILIGLVAAALVLWLVFSLEDTTNRTISNIFMRGSKANIENIDPIYTNAMINAKNYGFFSSNVKVSSIPELFWSTYIGKQVKNVSVIGRQTLDATQIQAFFSNYTFINTNTLKALKDMGLVNSDDATSMNANFLNYNMASIQSMLQTREKIPEFAAYNYDLNVKFSDESQKEMHAVVMRVISSATGEPYKHMRWAVSVIY